MNHRYPDLIGVLLTIYGLYASINSPLYSLVDKLFRTSYLSSTLLFLSLLGFLAMLIFYIKPVKSIPIALYGITMFDITLVYAHRWVYLFLENRTGLLRLLLRPDLIYIPIAFLISIAILSVRRLRTPINIMYSTSFIKLFIASLFLSIPIAYLQGMFGIGFKFPKMNLIQFIVTGILGGTILIIIFYYIALSLLVRAGGGYKGKRRFPHLTESYPPLKIDGKPTYYRVSDLHVRAYRMYRVYRGELSQQVIEELLRRLRKTIIYYGLDGYVYIYLVSEAYRISKAVEKLNIAENMLTYSLNVDIVEEDPENMLKLVKEKTMPRDIPEEIDRDRLRFLVDEENLGLALVYEYSGWMSEGRYTPRKIYVKSGLYTVATDIGRHKHLTELESKYKISSAQATVYSWNFLRLTIPVRMSMRYTPLNVRKKRIHLDGSKQLVGNISIKLPKVSIDIPLDHHIFFLGKTDTGKSTAIADIVKYINSLGDKKVVIFDWVGNFVNLGNILNKSIVVRPGEDIFVDLYRVFTKDELFDVYEEAAILSYEDPTRASFTAIQHRQLKDAVEHARNHSELVEYLNNIVETTPYENIRNSAAAVVDRLAKMNPDLYTPIEEVEGDPVKIIDKYNVVIVDLASLVTDDQILFAVLLLRVLVRIWNSSKPMLYLIIDEAHRLAPNIRTRKQLILPWIAKEGRKYNIRLILADQTLAFVSPDIWSNMGHVFLFHFDDPDDLRKVYPKFSIWGERYKLTSRTLEEYVNSRFRMGKGECYLVEFGGDSEPIPAYFDYTEIVETGEYKKIDEKKFRKVLEELDVYNLPNPKENVRKAIITARRMIRKYELDEILEEMRKVAVERMRKMEIDGYLLIRWRRDKLDISLPLRIYLAYYNKLDVIQQLQ